MLSLLEMSKSKGAKRDEQVKQLGGKEMGLLNVIKLANDYNKVKKAIKNNKVNTDKIKGYIDTLNNLLDWLRDFRVDIEQRIATVKEMIKKLKEMKGE